jgi:hypothetical protein
MKQFIVVAITALFLLSASACNKKQSQATQKAPVKGKVVQAGQKK